MICFCRHSKLELWSAQVRGQRRKTSQGKRRPGWGCMNRWVIMMWASSWCNVCSIHTEQGRGGELETDNNSCADGEECHVFKGLANTPEVCFHSLIQQQWGHYRCTHTRGWTCLWDLVIEGIFSSTLSRAARWVQVRTPVAGISTLSSVSTELRQQRAQTSVWFANSELIWSANCCSSPVQQKPGHKNTTDLPPRWLFFHTPVTTAFSPPHQPTYKHSKSNILI